MQHSRGGTVLRFVIGQENSRNFLNQSEPKLKLITTWSPAYSRVFPRFSQFVILTSSCHWLFKVFSFLLNACCDYFGLAGFYDNQ